MHWASDFHEPAFDMKAEPISVATGLIRIGYRKPLLQSDLWDVCRRDEANIVCGCFHENLEGTKRQRTTPKVLLSLLPPYMQLTR